MLSRVPWSTDLEISTMKDEQKTKRELIRELEELRRGMNERQHVEAQRLRSKAKFLAGENKYRTLVENIPQKIFVKDRNSVYVSCNERYARDLKIHPDEISGKNDYDFYPSEMAEKYILDDRRVLQTENAESMEEGYIQDGEDVFVQTVKTPIKNRNGDVVGILGIFWDITERKRADEELKRHRAHLEDLVFERTTELQTMNEQLQREIAQRKISEEALRSSEQKYSTLVENSLTGIYIDQDARIQFANQRFADIYGYPREEVLGIESWKLVHPDDREFTNRIREKRLKREETPSEYEARGLTRQGEIIWITRRNTLIEYGGRPAILGNIADITGRKLTENALRESEEKLRSLSSHLLTAQERERRRVSLELHDELGQALTVLKLQLRSMERKLRHDPPSLRDEIKDTLGYIDQIIENVRRLSRDLSPSILEDLGLHAALRWLAEDFGRHFQMETSITLPEINHLFSPEAQIVIYRMVQEALTNAGKHSNATRTSVLGTTQGGAVSFLVEDNGKGFDVNAVMVRKSAEKGLGLAAMHERARMLGGSLKVESKEGTGTRVFFSIPLDEKGKE
jgi:PAS domain S-box-containing protein